MDYVQQSLCWYVTNIAAVAICSIEITLLQLLHINLISVSKCEHTVTCRNMNTYNVGTHHAVIQQHQDTEVIFYSHSHAIIISVAMNNSTFQDQSRTQPLIYFWWRAVARMRRFNIYSTLFLGSYLWAMRSQSWGSDVNQSRRVDRTINGVSGAANVAFGF